MQAPHTRLARDAHYVRPQRDGARTVVAHLWLRLVLLRLVVLVVAAAAVARVTARGHGRLRVRHGLSGCGPRPLRRPAQALELAQGRAQLHAPRLQVLAELCKHGGVFAEVLPRADAAQARGHAVLQL